MLVNISPRRQANLLASGVAAQWADDCFFEFPMSLASKRRLLAVLAADVAGYTRLMEDSEEATHARFTVLMEEIVRPSLAKGGGRLVKSTGDGFLATFESAAAAADCALTMQERIFTHPANDNPPAMLFRMGLNQADVIVEQYDVFGDGVNLAARLQALAEPGGLVVSATVAELLRALGRLPLIDLGALSLKHMTRAARAFAVGMQQRALPKLAPVAPELPSIAVLPFRVRGNADDAYFAEGVIEGIIHVLSGIENLFVISRGTTQGYAEGPVDPRSIGRELGVRYVLTGSVQRAGSRLRIVTELSDAGTGTVVRTDRHDGAITDLFEMQDSISVKVVAAVAPTVREHELRRAMRKPPDSLTCYDLLLQATDLLYRLSPESFDRARGLLTQAMAHDEAFAPAYAHAATWHMFRIGQGWSPDIEADTAEADRLAHAALHRDPGNAVALAIHGHMLSFAHRQRDAASGFLERAISAGPSCAMAWTLASATSGYLGRGEEAVQRASRGLQLSPNDPFAFFAEHMLSQAHYVRGDFAAAVAWGQRAAARNAQLTSNLRTLAAAQVACGEIDAARTTARRLLLLDPEFSLTAHAARTPFQPELLDTHIGRLREAGLPD